MDLSGFAEESQIYKTHLFQLCWSSPRAAEILHAILKSREQNIHHVVTPNNVNVAVH